MSERAKKPTIKAPGPTKVQNNEQMPRTSEVVALPLVSAG
jgi:hypothetical protein